jgi:hypothetical protein
MEFENVAFKKEKVRGGGVCIFCGVDGNERKLTDEHTLPYALGGDTELLEATCDVCAAELSYVDGYLARSVFHHLRVHMGLHSRSGHPKVLPAIIESTVGQKVVDIDPKNHPYFLNLPAWNPPGAVLQGAKITDPFSNYHCNVYWYVPDNIKQTLGLTEAEEVEIVNNVKPHNLNTFARGTAKIAYCTAILKFGLDGFRPLFIPQIILGKCPYSPYFIGSLPQPYGPPHPRGQQHAVEFGTTTYRGLRLLTVNVRLFADGSAPQGGMPRYQVILGVDGKRKIIPKRALPNPRRPILL